MASSSLTLKGDVACAETGKLVGASEWDLGTGLMRIVLNDGGKKKLRAELTTEIEEAVGEDHARDEKFAERLRALGLTVNADVEFVQRSREISRLIKARKIEEERFKKEQIEKALLKEALKQKKIGKETLALDRQEEMKLLQAAAEIGKVKLKEQSSQDRLAYEEKERSASNAADSLLKEIEDERAHHAARAMQKQEKRDRKAEKMRMLMNDTVREVLTASSPSALGGGTLDRDRLKQSPAAASAPRINPELKEEQEDVGKKRVVLWEERWDNEQKENRKESNVNVAIMESREGGAQASGPGAAIRQPLMSMENALVLARRFKAAAALIKAAQLQPCITKKTSSQNSKSLAQQQREKEEEEGQCCVCMDRARAVLLVPCGHSALCGPCSMSIKAKTNRCPVCWNEIVEVISMI